MHFLIDFRIGRSDQPLPFLAGFFLGLVNDLGSTLVGQLDDLGTLLLGIPQFIRRLVLGQIQVTLGAIRCLEEKGIFTVRDLLRSTPKDLLSISNFGEKTLEEVYVSLEKIGYCRPQRQPVASSEAFR